MRQLALGFAILLAVLAGVLALSPGARSAFLEIFHLKGATVELVDTLPEVEVQTIDFGEKVSREEAERRVGFKLVDLGEPDAVFVRDRMASLVYGPVDKPRLVLSQLRGAVWDGFIKKVGGGGTRIEQVTVDGERGLFITGDEHFVMFLDENCVIDDEPTYLAGTVLLWNRGPLLLRLEGDLTRARGARARRSVGREPRRDGRCISDCHPTLEVRMKKLLLVLAVAAAVAVPAASAGGWATVGLSSLPPSGLEPNQAWPVDITVLQHGETPLAGVVPIVRIRDGGGKVVKSFTATPTGKTGVYHAVVKFPAPARSRTRSTTASAPTAVLRRTRSSRSRSARPAIRSRSCPSGSPPRSHSPSLPRPRSCGAAGHPSRPRSRI